MRFFHIELQNNSVEINTNLLIMQRQLKDVDKHLRVRNLSLNQHSDTKGYSFISTKINTVKN